MNSSVCILIPTVGQEFLPRALESAQKQTYDNVEILLVIDGPEYWQRVMDMALPVEHTKITCAPNNTGGAGFYGHRIYAGYPHLINTDMIAFLDEDNWLEPNHIETLVEKIESRRLDWAFSFRNIYSKEGAFVAPDKCESVGLWPIFWSIAKEHQFLIDTSSYCFRREFLIQVCQHWHSGWGGDRRFFATIKALGHTNFDTTALHTMNYRLDDDMEKKYGSLDFFIKGNEILKQAYGGNFPWESHSSSVMPATTPTLIYNIG